MAIKNSPTKTKLSAADIAILQNLETHLPTRILQEFSKFLDFIAHNDVEFSNIVMKVKFATAFNQQLQQPVIIKLKRPMQKSYPHVNGLFWLAMTTGLAGRVYQGKKSYLRLNETLLSRWQSLNPAMQWGILLDTWLMQATLETIAENAGVNDSSWLLTSLIRDAMPQGIVLADMKQQKAQLYRANLQLALAELFGLLEIVHGVPEEGEGWRIKRIDATPLGKALYALIGLPDESFIGYLSINTFSDEVISDDSEVSPLQALLEPYLPSWQRPSQASEEARYIPITGQYIFKVSLDRAWRRFSVPDTMTWDAFAHEILAHFDFMPDHLYAFEFKDTLNRQCHINHPYLEEHPFTTEVTIGEIGLQPNNRLVFIFDFGDMWAFKVLLEDILDEDTHSDGITVLKKHGTPPKQYPDYDDE